MGSELTLTDVHFRYGKPWCLEGVGFEVKKGEIIGIIGPNGSGKSTLLKAMDGLLKVQKGEILLGHTSIYSLKRNHIARHIAMVPQESLFRFPFSAFEIVLMGRFPHSGHLPDERNRHP